MPLRLGLILVSLILSVLIGLSLAPSHGSGGSEETASGFVVGLSLDTLQEERWQKDRDIIKAGVEALGGRLEVLAANSDSTKQASDIRAFITKGVDALMVVPFDGTAMGPLVDECAEAGIPVISYDRLITQTDNLLCYLSFDNVKVGLAQGRYLVEALKHKPNAKIIRVYGAPTDNNAKLFKQGQDEMLAPHIESGKIEVVHEAWAQGWRPEEATRIVAAALQAHPKVDAILASNDGTAGGAIAALPESMVGQVIITGQDAELEAVRRIAAGRQSMTIFKPLSVLAKEAAEVAAKAAQGKVIVANSELDNGKAMVPSRFSGIFTVTQENIMETVIRSGFLSYDDVYRDTPEGKRPPKL